MTTVGFGDFYPRTHVGRFVACLACAWGTFLISLMVMMLNNYVCFNRPQEKSYKFLKKLNDYKLMSEANAKYLKAAIEIYMYKRFHLLDENHELIKIRRHRMKYYKLISKEKRLDAQIRNTDIRDALIELYRDFSIDLNKIENHLKIAKNIHDQLDSIIERQKKILEILINSGKFSREIRGIIEFSAAKYY